MLCQCMCDVAKKIWDKHVIKEKPYKILVQGRKKQGRDTSAFLVLDKFPDVADSLIILD
jgi:hypothetical protein